MNPKSARHRQYFELTVASGNLDGEVERLRALGGSGGAVNSTGETVLNDPDGIELVVRTALG